MKIKTFCAGVFVSALFFAVTPRAFAIDFIESHIRLPTQPQYSWLQFAYWIDDDTLALGGFPDGEKWSSAHPENATYRLMFNVSTRSVDNLGLIRGFCFDNGYVSYTKIRQEPDGNSWVSYYGIYGQEIPIERKPVQRSSHNPQRQTWNCKDESELLPEDPLYNGQYSLAHLHQGDGYIEYRLDMTRMISAILHRTDGTMVPLTALANEDLVLPIKYRPDKKAYLIRSINRADTAKQLGFYWRWLYPDGRIEDALFLTAGNVHNETTAHFPSGKTAQVSNVDPYMVPLSNGDYIFGAGLIGRGGLAGFSGLYILKGHRVTKLANGRVSEIVVSPNGCRAAVGINSKSLTTFDYFLYVVDDCHDSN